MDTYEILREILVKDYKVPPAMLAPDAKLESLGVDSLGVMELLFRIEDVFHIQVPPDAAGLVCVRDVVSYIEQLVAQQAPAISAHPKTI